MKKLLVILLLLSSCGKSENNDKEREYDSLANIAVEKWKSDTVKAKAPLTIGTGIITTIVDGFDVKRVEIWSSTNGNTRTSKGFFTNNEKVTVLKDEDPYFLVEGDDNSGKRGYLMKGFVILDRVK